MKKNEIHILIIEDNPADLRLVREMLNESAEPAFKITSAGLLNDGIKILKKESPDAVLLDINLPDSKGLDGLNEIVKQTPAVPVVVLTGVDDENLGIKAIQSHATDYLVKGRIDTNLLVRTIRYAIERKGAEEEIRNLARFPSESPNPILRILKDGKISYANNASTELLKFWQRKVGQEIPSEWKGAVDEAIKKNRHIFKEITLNKSVVSFVITPLPDGGYVNIYGRDITEYRNAEKELQKVNLQLEDRVKERTEQLQHIVEVLQNEIKERTSAEQQLIDNQEKLRSLSSELIITEEKERREAASQLHDSIGQLLALSQKELGALAANAPEPMKTSLREVWDFIRQAVEGTRTLTFGLSSPTLYTFGFEAAVEELAEYYSQKEKFKYNFTCGQRGKPLTEQEQILLYRTIRELLINIVKHSQAKNVEIDIKRTDDDVHIMVSDDGVGFDADELKSRKITTGGFGLFSLRERLANIGGNMDVRSKKGKGTTVTLTVPLNFIKGKKQ